jgi:hypothetical protein
MDTVLLITCSVVSIAFLYASVKLYLKMCRLGTGRSVRQRPAGARADQNVIANHSERTGRAFDLPENSGWPGTLTICPRLAIAVRVFSIKGAMRPVSDFREDSYRKTQPGPLRGRRLYHHQRLQNAHCARCNSCDIWDTKKDERQPLDGDLQSVQRFLDRNSGKHGCNNSGDLSWVCNPLLAIASKGFLCFGMISFGLELRSCLFRTARPLRSILRERSRASVFRSAPRSPP